MAIHLRTDRYLYEIGTSDFFKSFFDTIDVRLTKGIFSHKFSIVLDEFQEGRLRYENLDKAKQELLIIRKKLKKYKPHEIVWDKYDNSKQPPWGNDISEDIKELSTYFVTSDGKDLFEVIFEAITAAKEQNCDLTIE